MRFLRHILFASCAVFASQSARAESWQLEAPTVPFDDDSQTQPLLYQPLDHAAKPWRLCVLYPHLKDAYWLSVNYGMVEEANRLGVSFDLYEAGGYPNLDRQIEQVKACGKRHMDALIIGPVSYDGLSPAVLDIAQQMPVIAAVNDMDDAGISAKASVSWREMGAAAGRAIAQRHPKGSPAVKLAWFPGPKGAGWVQFVEQGFFEALAESSAQIVATRYGDTGVDQQVLLVEDILDSVPEVNYLVGSGPMAEAAVSILRARNLTGRIGIVSTYVSHGVYRGIKRGRILAAPTDFAVLQGRLAVELAVRAIEGNLTIRHAGPRIVTLTPENIDEIGTQESLTPASFVPVFKVSN
ncbi:TMAO reductase system periplasmic protein TorT [Cypionkella sp.]|uniref:TMAO reductase system periplasmic protein TorT n=1 Tax=Cypionkella sp. TaxID=2811411 RepID=UPI002718FFF2|nr:TMAO reductase system periplasmic protein TorT [Cypionkella sp.]MDO8984108.1 TMAO reductase system periplasmic protein TorT [Cypionkella sp.]MDP2047782.1 TMAO reductase system periplasmic protein TorT [Cypionkella sp.]